MRKIKPPTLRPAEEDEILRFVIEKAKKGEPVVRQDILELVVKFVTSDHRQNLFRNGVPGDKWFCLFRRRHNAEFTKLEPKMLRAVEAVGFTEKVMNTVQYSKTPGAPVTMKDPFRARRKKQKRASLTSPSEAHSPPASEESCNTTMMDNADTSRGQESQGGDTTDFRPGSKLEVMDFNEKWYPVKVVEVDYEEGEVLVHFEKWSDRYDEWVPMDSNRIRQPVLQQTSIAKKVFSVNEKVIAVWAYNHKYPATVKQVLPNDKYEVLFSDGYAKVLRGCKLFKASEEDLKNVQLPPPKKPAPPMGADPLDPDLGPKEERRLKKRRLDVLESYRPHKRQKTETPQSTPETSPQPSTSSYQPREMPKVVLKARGRPPMKHKKRSKYYEEDDDDDLIDEEKEEEDEDEEEEEDEKEEKEEMEQESEKPKSNRGRHKKRQRRKTFKKPFDEAKYMYRPKQKPENEEDLERWNTEIPKGASPVQIKDQEGYYRESVIIPDKKLPPGWSKHTMRRKNGAKWDVLLVNPQGRKFRSRNDLRNYFTEIKKPFPEESFDFMVGRKMEMIKSQEENRKKVPGGQVNKASPVHKLSDGEGLVDSKKTGAAGTPDSKRIKTLLPKSRLSDAPGEGKGGSPATPTLISPPFTLADVKNPDGGFTCCGKSFRKENLFQMHMKHYHPEYSNLFGSTPNVADLAYARTVGEPLEDSRAEAMTPKNTLMERVTKYEAERKALSDTNTSTVTSLVTATAAPTNVPADASTPDPARIKEEVQEIDLEPAPPAPAVTEEPVPLTTKEEQAEEQPTPRKKQEVKAVEDESEVSKEEEEVAPAADDTTESKEETKTADVLPTSPTLVEEMKAIPFDDKLEEPPPPAPEEKEEAPTSEPTPSPSPPPPVTPATPSILSLPVIKPVSKMTPGTSKTAVTSEAVIVQTTPSAKTPVTITKYVPPGQKPAATSTTKMTISLASAEKETKPTIKTLLPMRPPPVEPKEETPKKEVKLKEEVEDETPVKSRPRKRTVSESLPRKPKLVKPSTGSLEEEPEVAAEVPSTPTASYRFSRNRTMPRVSLEKLNINTDRNGRVVVPTPEDKMTYPAGRRQFKNFRPANKISKKPKEGNAANPPQPASVSEVVYENLRKEEIINCTCGYMEEDGLMIQCDLCLCWQHGLCNNIDKEADVPEKYVCYICQHPVRQRATTVHRHNQDWLKEGQLPSLSFRSKNKDGITQRETMLKKSHDLVSSLLQLQTVIHSLRVKTHIATKPDHPKLYLWAKSWKAGGSEVKMANYEDNLKQVVSGPQPEAAIDETECRLQLLEHVEDYQHQVDDRLTSIQAQIAALESEDPDLASDEASDHYPITKQTVQMVLRDLNTVRKVAALN